MKNQTTTSQNASQLASDRGQRGLALVEFALTLPLALLLLFGTIELGRAVFYYNSLANAAREGARAGVVMNHSGDWSVSGNAPGTYAGDAAVDPTTIVGRVVRGAIGLPPADLTITIEAPDRRSWLYMPVTVTVECPFTPITNMIIGGDPIDLQAIATMRIE